MMDRTEFEATADVCDRLGSAASVCQLPLIAYGGRPALAGQIACVRVDEDASPVRRLLEQPGRGRILIVDGGGSRRVALLGERMAHLGLQNGWAGVVVHGAIRDATALQAIPFGVFALGTVPRRPEGTNPIAAEERQVACGGVSFTCGDWVCVDRDGLVGVSGTE